MEVVGEVRGIDLYIAACVRPQKSCVKPLGSLYLGLEQPEYLHTVPGQKDGQLSWFHLAHDDVLY